MYYTVRNVGNAQRHSRINSNDEISVYVWASATHRLECTAQHSTVLFCALSWHRTVSDGDYVTTICISGPRIRAWLRSQYTQTHVGNPNVTYFWDIDSSYSASYAR